MSERKRRRERKCPYCGKMYLPDPRTQDRQKCCQDKACKKKRKARSQRRWQDKPENADYFRGSAHVARTQAWRRTHPGYSKGRPKRPVALQDDCSSQPIDGKEDKHGLSADALQDDCLLQSPVMVGLASQLTGSPLQDDIALFLRRMHSCGIRILGMVPGDPSKGVGDDRQTSIVPAAVAAGAGAVQLGGPAPGEGWVYQKLRT